MNEEILKKADLLAAAVYPKYRGTQVVNTVDSGGKELVDYLEARTGIEIFTTEDAEQALQELGVL